MIIEGSTVYAMIASASTNGINRYQAIGTITAIDLINRTATIKLLSTPYIDYLRPCQEIKPDITSARA